MLNALSRIIFICCSLTAIAVCATGCRPRLIAGKYLVDAIGEPGRCLFFDDGTVRVEPNVVSVGWDDRHVIVRQRPDAKTRHRYPKSQDCREPIFYYYIIEHTKDVSYADAKDVVSGPFVKDEFYAEREQMGVSSNLDFMVNFN